MGNVEPVATILAAAAFATALLLYFRPPPWLRGFAKGIETPEKVGKAAAATIAELFKNAAYIDPETGEETLMTPGEAFTSSMQQVAAGAVLSAMPIILEEAPRFLAMAKYPSLAKEWGEQSHVARGFSGLKDADLARMSAGIQGLFSKSAEGFGKGAVGNNPMLGKLMAGKQLAEGLGIDVGGLVQNAIGGASGDNGPAPSQSQPSLPKLGKPM